MVGGSPSDFPSQIGTHIPIQSGPPNFLANAVRNRCPMRAQRPEGQPEAEWTRVLKENLGLPVDFVDSLPKFRRVMLGIPLLPASAADAVPLVLYADARSPDLMKSLLPSTPSSPLDKTLSACVRGLRKHVQQRYHV